MKTFLFYNKSKDEMTIVNAKSEELAHQYLKKSDEDYYEQQLVEEIDYPFYVKVKGKVVVYG